MSDDVLFEEAYQQVSVQATTEEGKVVDIPPERLPKLLGWTVLLRPWAAPEKVGGLFLPDTVRDANEFMAYIFQVVALGPLAFTHPRLRGGLRHGSRWTMKEGSIESWHYTEETDLAEGIELPKPGDWVIVRKFAGIDLRFDGGRLRICNDDDIIATIDSPDGWQAYV